jgi:hypothetical protein
MQKAIKRVECGNEEAITQKTTLGMSPGTPSFCGTVTPPTLKKKKPSIILFRLETNFDAPPFVYTGTSFIHAMVVIARCDSSTP